MLDGHIQSRERDRDREADRSRPNLKSNIKLQIVQSIEKKRPLLKVVSGRKKHNKTCERPKTFHCPGVTVI